MVNTAKIDKSPHASEIRELLIKKDKTIPYEQISREIKEKFNEIYTERALRYYRSMFISPDKYEPNKTVKEGIKRQWDAMRLIEVKEELLDISKQRVMKGKEFEARAMMPMAFQGQAIETHLRTVESLEKTLGAAGLVNKVEVSQTVNVQNEMAIAIIKAVEIVKEKEVQYVKNSGNTGNKARNDKTGSNNQEVKH